MWINQLQIIGEIALSMFLGGILGIEREISDKPAGFRTIMLVAGATTLLMRMGDVLIVHYSEMLAIDIVKIDPSRIIQAVITGISFLGAGTIIRRRQDDHVEGLTTAAIILLAGGIGICVALNQFILAIGVTILGLIVARILGIIHAKIHRQKL